MRVPAPLDPASLAPVLVPSVAGARTLPAAAYVSPEVFAWERDVLLGGADFGAGTLELFSGPEHKKSIKKTVYSVMGPVWEANHDCCSLLASFAASLPLRRPSSIATLDMARYLLTRSEGTIGELAHLLMAAAVAAVIFPESIAKL